MPATPRGVSYVWQAKDLREVVFGSVAMIGVTGDFLEVWQRKGLAALWKKVEVWERVRKRTAGRGHINCRFGLLTKGKDSMDLAIDKVLCRER